MLGKTPLPLRFCARRAGPATLRMPETPLHAPDRYPPYPHPARLILILSLAPTVGLGIGRFAYALVLPDMRELLGWSYSAAGFMNTINAVGYLAGALTASSLIKRFGLAPSVIWGTAACVASLALCALTGNFIALSLARLLAGFARRRRLRRRRRAGGDDRAVAPGARQFPAQPVLCRARHRHPRLRIDRAVRAAGIRAGIVVDRVVGDDGACRVDHDRAAVAGAARRRRQTRNRRRGEILRPARADLSCRLFPVRRGLHRLHDVHDRLCPRRRRRGGGAERRSGA